jgi:hypothetical protein
MTTKALSTDQFRDLLRREIQHLCHDHSLNYDNEADRGYAFQVWVARLFAQRDAGIETDPEEASFSTNDCKIDVVLEDPNQKVLYLAQCKYPSVASNPPIDDGGVNDFFGRHALFLDRAWVHKHASEDLQFYIGDYEDRLADGYQFHYYFVSTGRATDRTKELAPAFTSRCREENPGVAFYVIDFYDLKEYYVETQTLSQSIPDKVRLELAEGRFIEKKSPHPTVPCHR